MSESVVKGTGAITLACATGSNFTADISTSTVVGTKVFFPSPGVLTDGQVGVRLCSLNDATAIKMLGL